MLTIEYNLAAEIKTRKSFLTSQGTLALTY